MFKNFLNSFVVLAVALMASTSNAQFTQIAEVNFDDIPAIGIPLGGSFASGGVDIDVLNGGFVGGIGVSIENPVAPFFLATFPHVATPNNVGMDFNMPTVPGPTNMITFDYFNQGGAVSLEINGVLVGPVGNFPNAVAVGGAFVTNNFAMVGGNLMGTVRITSATPITSFLVGGQETQFDNFRFFERTLLGDVNCDGEVNLLDVNPFVELLASGGYSPKADMNMDGAVDLLDVNLFIDALN